MSNLVQWIITGVIVVGAIIFLLRRLRPSDKSCCSGCPYAGSCGAASSKLKDCGAPELRDKQAPQSKSSQQ